jgi:PelA/Pel-15E family pectate lyase
MIRNAVVGLLCALVAAVGSRLDAAPPTKADASQALRRAVDFFRADVSASGAYLWRYSADLTKREGEGRASKATAWVQPPGTPSVGGAFLFAYEATGDEHYLQAARETAHALVQGQLRSGGWDYRIEFEKKPRRKYAYRVVGGDEGARNVTTLDDDTTQSALRYLMLVDRALNFKDEKIHESIQYALAALLKAQYPNGAWPQRFSEPPDPAKHPVLKASYQETWSRTHPNKDYKSFYTFNDDTIADTIATMFEAERIYKDRRYGEAAKKAGDFIILAQMPEPQPAWAQQYDAEMNPAWARRFEPASVTGGESQGVIRTLMSIYRETGDRRFLEPIPRALKYLKASELPNGQLARFYELKTNRPLYFTKKYELTYKDDDMPTHYGFKVSSRVDRLQSEYDKLLRADPASLKTRDAKPSYKMSSSLAKQAEKVGRAMDKRGAWVETGRLRTYDDGDNVPIIETTTFIANVQTLSKFIAASQ